MKSTELAFKAYIQARKRMDEGYDDYVKSCQKSNKNMVMIYNGIEPFASLNEALFWAMTLYDLVKDNMEHKSEIFNYMSGLKFIINTMKHSKKIFDPYSFCHPGIKISGKVKTTPTGPVFEELNFDPIIVFSDFDESHVPRKNLKQLSNYNALIKGKNLSEIMRILDSYMQELLNISR